MEGEMARPGAPAGRRERRIVGHELAARTIQPIDEDPIGAAVGRHQKTPARIKRHIMGVRPRPRLIAVRADFARRRHHIGERRQRSIGIDRKHRHPRTVADHDVAVARVRRQVGRIVALSRLLVEKFDPAAWLVDRVGGDFGSIAVHRIEEALLAIEGDELRIGHGLERLQERPGAARIDSVDADAFSLCAASFGGKAPDIGKERNGAFRFLGRCLFRRRRQSAGGERRARRSQKKRPASVACRRQGVAAGALGVNNGSRFRIRCHDVISPLAMPTS